MPLRNLANFSNEELNSKIKTLMAINFILSFVIVMFFGYLFYVLYMDKWTETNLAGVISITVMIAVIAINASNISGIKKELNKRS